MKRLARGDRLLYCLMDREDIVQPGDREDAKHRPARANEGQGPFMFLHALQAADERPEARAVHEGDALKVDDDLVPALIHGLNEALAELGRREHVDLTLDVDDRPRTFLTRFNDEVDRRHPLLDAVWLDYPGHNPVKQQCYPEWVGFLFQALGVGHSAPDPKEPE